MLACGGVDGALWSSSSGHDGGNCPCSTVRCSFGGSLGGKSEGYECGEASVLPSTPCQPEAAHESIQTLPRACAIRIGRQTDATFARTKEMIGRIG